MKAMATKLGSTLVFIHIILISPSLSFSQPKTSVILFTTEPNLAEGIQLHLAVDIVPPLFSTKPLVGNLYLSLFIHSSQQRIYLDGNLNASLTPTTPTKSIQLDKPPGTVTITFFGQAGLFGPLTIPLGIEGDYTWFADFWESDGSHAWSMLYTPVLSIVNFPPQPPAPQRRIRIPTGEWELIYDTSEWNLESVIQNKDTGIQRAKLRVISGIKSGLFGLMNCNIRLLNKFLRPGLSLQEFVMGEEKVSLQPGSSLTAHLIAPTRPFTTSFGQIGYDYSITLTGRFVGTTAIRETYFTTSSNQLLFIEIVSGSSGEVVSNKVDKLLSGIIAH